MKKQLFLFAYTLLGFATIAQNCNINAALATSPGIYPPAPGYIDTAGVIFMPDAEVGIAYDVTAQVKVPLDTIVDTLGFQLTVTIDSLKIHALENLPPGISFVCDNGNCSWPGNANGCVRLTGTPSASAIGPDYSVLVKTIGYGTMPILGNVIDTFFFEMQLFVVNGGLSSVENTLPNLRIAPNPANEFISLSAADISIDRPATILLQSISGQRVYASTTILSETEIRIPVANLPAGMYFILVQMEGAILREKILIQH